ncbi:hypothetical protein BKA83DRAFT_14293 [Pisolithus microcarpus]|nr:hypothetical protein BKA83DRAFT_14293 [Pisolithus microcarpus]
MVTQNVETDLDITNGARGVIQDIFLHPHEPPLTTDTGMHHLKHMPSYILVKLGWTRTLHLQGLEPSVIPVEPAVKTYSIRYVNSQGTPVTRHVQRLQYPVTPAFAFTDYRSQGQTLSHVIVDISRPPTGGLNLFNLYVALSRSSGHETIRLLRDFDEKLFLCSHSTDLIAEDDRLADLRDKTLACVYGAAPFIRNEQIRSSSGADNATHRYIPLGSSLKVFVAELDSNAGRTESRVTRDKRGLRALETIQLDIGRLNAVIGALVHIRLILVPLDFLP